MYLTSSKERQISLEEIRRWKNRGGVPKCAMKKREKEKAPWPNSCTLHVLPNFNNTFVTVSDTLNGRTVAWASAGTCKFKNAKKKSAYSAKVVIGKIVKRLLRKEESPSSGGSMAGPRRLKIIISGASWSKTPSRYFIRSLLCVKKTRRQRGAGSEKRKGGEGPSDPIYITAIKDVTPFPHNGCRPRKRRRKKKRTRRRFKKLPRHPKAWLNLKDRLHRRETMFEGRKKAKRRKKRPKVRIREAISFLREFYKETEESPLRHAE